MQTSQQCYLYIGGRETDTHLFLHYTFCKYILRLLLLKMDLEITRETRLQFLLGLLEIHDGAKRSIALLMAQVFCYFIWRERHACRHDKGTFDPNKILEGIKVHVKAKLQSSV